VKNYEWSARMDGGYDCKTTIITTGEIIESLKVNYIKPTAITATTGLLTKEFANNGTSNGWVPSYSENALAGMWAEAYYKLNTSISPDVVIKAGSPILEEGNINQAQFTNFYISSNTDNEKSLSRQNSNFQVYLTLPVVFELLNRYIIAKSATDGEGLVRLSLKDRDGDDLLCVAHPLQVSVDPGICLIKSPKWYEQEGIIQKQIIEANKNDDIKKALTVYNTLKGLDQEYVEDKGGDRVLKRALNVLYFIDTDEAFLALSKQIQTQKLSLVGTEYTELSSFLNALSDNTEGDAFKVALELRNYFKNKNTSISLTFTGDTTGEGYQNITQDNINTVQGYWDNYFSRQPTFAADAAELEKYGINVGLINYGFSQLKYGGDVSTFIGISNIQISTTKKIEGSKAASQVVIAANGPQALANLSLLKYLPRDYFVDYSDPTGNLQELGYLKGIYVNLDYLYLSALNADQQSADDKGKEEISLYNYIKKLMQDIQSVTGNVNDFEIHVDPIDNNVARVIDVKYTEKTKVKSTNLYLLPVHQLGSTVRSYSLQSQIFPNQSALVAIGSQAKSGGALGIQANTMIDFNRRITDRILAEKGDGTLDVIVASLEDVKKQLLSINNGLSKVVAEFATLQKADNSSLPSYDTEISAAKTGLKDTIAQIQAITNSPGSNRNIIPTKFSCEIDGIGGLVIGNMFRLPNHVMPKGYRGENGVGVQLGNAVTGIAHTIKDGDWVTKIDSLNIVLDNPVEVLPIAQMATAALGNIAAAKLGTKASPSR
jgi:hypothetical protein